jgi:cytosine/adenosine deaminase-related metal-dependent hydrolase
MIRNLVAFCVLAGALGEHLTAQTLTITNATVVDVSTGTLRRATTVVIDGKRITSVGPASSTAPRPGRIVDAKGMYVIPGLWDMHTHAYFGWSSDFGDTYVLPLFIANGITGIATWGATPMRRSARDVRSPRTDSWARA